jgi:nicotinate phosphoribosyltransferase
VIVASSDLDEYKIAELKQRGAKIAVWGVGTRLATAYDDPALTGVYKISAIREPGGDWKHKIKLSDDPAKASTPGIQQVRRFSRDGRFVADLIYDETRPPDGEWSGRDVDAAETTIAPPDGSESEDLLEPVFRSGKPAYTSPSIEEMRRRCLAQLDALDPALRAIAPSAQYPVGLETGLFELKQKLVAATR